jgi:hypothetical protein
MNSSQSPGARALNSWTLLGWPHDPPCGNNYHILWHVKYTIKYSGRIDCNIVLETILFSQKFLNIFYGTRITIIIKNTHNKVHIMTKKYIYITQRPSKHSSTNKTKHRGNMRSRQV